MADLGNVEFSQLYRSAGAVSTVYCDVSQATKDPRHTMDLRLRTVREALENAGAPKADTEAIDRLLQQAPGIGGPVSRFAIVREGNVEVDELLPGEPIAEQLTSYGQVPNLIPLLLHRPRDLSYVVAEVGRDGGEIRLYRLNRARPVSDQKIEGDDQYITKVHVGGWSQSRYQRDAEQIWKRNEGQLAEAIDEVVRDQSPDLLVVSGDVRARQLLLDQLAPASRNIVAVAAANTRADGASNQSLDEELHQSLTAILARDEDDALNRLGIESGHEDGLAEVGLGAVVHALRQAQVDTLLLDRDRLGDKKLIALDKEPWLATAPEDALGASELGHIAAVDSLVRAAVLTDARVILMEDTDLPGEESVAALLRWPTGPTTPGA